MMASPAWKSRSLWQRSRRKIPKHFSSSDVEAYKKIKENENENIFNVYKIRVEKIPHGWKDSDENHLEKLIIYLLSKHIFVA